MAANTHSLDLESGSSQYASIADNASLSLTGDFTIEAWIKCETVGGDIVSKWEDSAGQTQASYLLRIDTNQVQFLVSANGSAATSIKASTFGNLATGIWYHVVAYHDTTNDIISVAVNGIANTTAHSTGVFDSDAAFVIGAHNPDAPTAYFDGLIDDVRVWNDVRTDTEIHDNIFADVSGDAGLVSWWKLDNDYTDSEGSNDLTSSGSPVFSTTVPFPEYRDLNPVALAASSLGSDANLQGAWSLDDVLTDSSGNGNTLTNNNAAPFAAGKFNNGIDLESGSSQYLSITDASQTGLALSGDFTLTCWESLESAPSSNTNMILIAKNTFTTANRSYRLFYRNNAGTLQIRLEVSEDGGTTNRDTLTWNFPLPIGSLTHLAVAYDVSEAAASKSVLYINGISMGNGTVAVDGGVSSIFDSTAPFTIGANDSTPAEFFDGIIDDPGVFNRILTASEIFDLYTGVPLAGGGELLLMGAGS